MENEFFKNHKHLCKNYSSSIHPQVSQVAFVLPHISARMPFAIHSAWFLRIDFLLRLVHPSETLDQLVRRPLHSLKAACCGCCSSRKHSETRHLSQPGVEVTACSSYWLSLSEIFFCSCHKAKTGKEICVKECSPFFFCGDCVS